MCSQWTRKRLQKVPQNCLHKNFRHFFFCALNIPLSQQDSTFSKAISGISVEAMQTDGKFKTRIVSKRYGNKNGKEIVSKDEQIADKILLEFISNLVNFLFPFM